MGEGGSVHRLSDCLLVIAFITNSNLNRWLVLQFISQLVLRSVIVRRGGTFLGRVKPITVSDF